MKIIKTDILNIKKNTKKNNKEKYNKYQKQYTQNRLKNDFYFKLICNIRNNFKRNLKYNLISKTKKQFDYTGISFKTYVEYLKNNPLYDDYCNGKNIHVDHIIPVSAYDFNDENEIKKCWHYRNLRLLDGVENMSKNNKIDYDLIKQHGIEDLLPDSLSKAGTA